MMNRMYSHVSASVLHTSVLKQWRDLEEFRVQAELQTMIFILHCNDLELSLSLRVDRNSKCPVIKFPGRLSVVYQWLDRGQI